MIMRTGKWWLCALLALSACAASPQQRADEDLRQQLLDMGAADEKYRSQMATYENLHEPSEDDEYALTRLIGLQGAADAENIAQLENIVTRRGWPERSRVGSRAAEAAFRILLHADPAAQRRLLPALRAAAAAGEARPQDLKAIEDKLQSAARNQQPP